MEPADSKLNGHPNIQGWKQLRQFRPDTLLLLTFLIGIPFGFVKIYLDSRPAPYWDEYSDSKLSNSLHEGRVVLVNFRAAWDTTSVVYEATALETPRVREWVRSNGATVLRADVTDGSPELRSALQSLDVNFAIPTVAIYSPLIPDEPIVIGDVVTEQKVLDALILAERRK